MADPFSIASGVVDIVAEAMNKIKELVNFINDIKDTPNTVRQLKDELVSVEAVLQSLRGTLERDTGSQSWTQLLQSSRLVDAIKTLRSNCNAFKEMLQTWTKRSGSGNKFSFRNSINPALSQSKISAMLTQLDRCKQTVTMALSSCALQTQLQSMQVTNQTRSALLSQENNAIKLSKDIRANVVDLLSKENSLKLVRQRTEASGDVDDIQRADVRLREVSGTRVALNQFQSVPEFIAKVSIAARTEQIIGKVSISDQGYGSVGITNVNEVLDVKQKIGDVNVGKAGTVFVGIHNNIDHKTALANRWGTSNKS